MSQGQERGKLQFRVNGYTGIDLLFSWVYSYRRMAKRIARKAMRTGAPFCDHSPSDVDLLILLPDGAYRVTDEKGNVEPYSGRVTNVGL